ncbi:MAG: hypothetical protein KDK53_19045 [Maritimibacter sp.]|nr:hypothetical protein [Maritimibacter sp.]
MGRLAGRPVFGVMGRSAGRSILSILMAFGLLCGPALNPGLAQDTAGTVPETEGACLDAGGRWERGGLGGQLLCFLPTPDAGQACSAADDCSGFCLVESGTETGTCSAETPMFGCFSYVDLDGAEVTLCID